MTKPVLVPATTRGGSIAALAVGILIGGFGFLAAIAQGMATAPGSWDGVIPLALMVIGAALALVGVASLAVASLRPVAKKGAIAALAGLIGLYVLGQVLMMAGYDV